MKMKIQHSQIILQGMKILWFSRWFRYLRLLITFPID